MNDEIWTAADIAEYLKMHRSNVYTHVISQPDFPKPIMLPTKKSSVRTKPRYFRSEVMQWLKKRQK